MELIGVLCSKERGSRIVGWASNSELPTTFLVRSTTYEAKERAQAAGNDPIPKITLDHVTVNFARSGGPGGQNVNKGQAIIEAASYVPPPPSEEQVKRINKLAAIGERKWLDNKKAQSQKKAMRRSRDSYD
ncbi:hypothetical protein RND71_042794 [Anisodus tanguticus]|uniref:Prokaryotic-type class I peptide chain release factors domain-containing protein n=1 Tax=Anisodus tanguticus TaxID=243964 RepID=A0AAE1QUA6_9SOLA|nr:hypothetical protein RND71_042794 [Anisodus tanguticus]